MKRLLDLAFVAMLVLAGCGQPAGGVVEGSLPGAAVTQVAPSATSAATPTRPSPTSTALPTPTLLPSATPTPGATASATPSALPSATPAGAGAAGTTPEGVAIRPDLPGKLAFTRGNTIMLYVPRSGALAVLIEDGRDPQFSPDGSQLAFVREDGLYLAAADGSNVRRLVEGRGLRWPRWSDDASRLVYQQPIEARSNATVVYALELALGTPVRIAEGADPAWDPAGKRIAYVTAVPNSSAGPRRNELHLVNWRGQNDWTVVRGLPADTPAIGIPGNQVPPAQLEHVMVTPLWNADGSALYVPAFVLYQALTDFTILERADPVNGGSVFVAQGAFGRATAAPNRQVAVFEVPSARGDVQLTVYPLNETDDRQRYAWAATSEVALHAAPAWAPDSNALAALRCRPETPGVCDLILRAPGQTDSQVLIPRALTDEDAVMGEQQLTWGR